MRTVVSLSVYLESYSITREQFMAEVNKDREFYDKYIDWKNKDSDTIISPKALERLGEAFNDNKIEELKADQVNMEDIMNAPKESESKTEIKTEDSEVQTESKKRQRKAEDKPRKKKSKNTITKQFIAEHGQLTPEMMQDTKLLRMFLMGAGYKAEQVALMGDEEVKNAVCKDYFFINTEDGLYVIKRSALVSIAGDVCFIGKEIQ